MNVEQLQSKLIAAARRQAPGDNVPYAFERRVLAHLRSWSLPDAWALWSRALWRAAAPCLAIVFLLGLWAWFQPAAPAADLSEAFENTVLAGVPEPIADSM